MLQIMQTPPIFGTTAEENVVEELNAYREAVWKMEDSNGDDEMGNHALTWVNSPSFASGKDGNAVTLNGSNERATLAATGNLPVWDNTYNIFSLWCKGVSQSQKVIYCESNGSTSNGARYVLGPDYWDGSVFRVFIRDNGANNAIITGTDTVFDNTWHHVCVFDDNKTVSIYVDGSFDASGSYSSLGAKTLNAYRIGDWYFTGGEQAHFAGSIDEFYWWVGAMPTDKGAFATALANGFYF